MYAWDISIDLFMAFINPVFETMKIILRKITFKKSKTFCITSFSKFERQIK